MKKRYVLTIFLLMFLLIPSSVNASRKLYTTGDVNLRKGPGRDYGIYTVVKKGTSLTYKDDYEYDERDVKWYLVKYKNKKAWVSSRYASFSKPSKSKKVVTTGDVNLRWGPGKEFDIYCAVKKGKSLTYKGKSEKDDRGVKWYKVSYKDHNVWVSSKYSKLK